MPKCTGFQIPQHCRQAVVFGSNLILRRFNTLSKGRRNMSIIGKVESLWRYPVKSMRGEEVDTAFLGFAGIYGDRLFAFRSAASPKGFPLKVENSDPRDPQEGRRRRTARWEVLPLDLPPRTGRSQRPRVLRIEELQHLFTRAKLPRHRVLLPCPSRAALPSAGEAYPRSLPYRAARWARRKLSRLWVGYSCRSTAVAASKSGRTRASAVTQR